MEKTPSGTSVGVEDPYAFAGRCDHVTGDGRCRFAVERAASDPAFARERRAEGYACPVGGATPASVDDTDDRRAESAGGAEPTNQGGRTEPEDDPAWRDCPHYRSRARGRECVRCGLEERPRPGSERPLLDEHHLSYAESAGPAGPCGTKRTETTAGETSDGSKSADGRADPEPSHEITVSLCRWCHAKVDSSWARIDDDASPDPEAITAREGRLTRERAESAFETAAERSNRK